MKLHLGHTVITPAAEEVLTRNAVLPSTLLMRHQRGDWGKLSPEDAQSNNEAVQAKNQILSCYAVGSEDVWVITDAGHEVTTILLPSDY